MYYMLYGKIHESKMVYLVSFMYLTSLSSTPAKRCVIRKATLAYQISVISSTNVHLVDIIHYNGITYFKYVQFGGINYHSFEFHI